MRKANDGTNKDIDALQLLLCKGDKTWLYTSRCVPFADAKTLENIRI